MTTTETRYRAPDQATDSGDDMSFRVWVIDDTHFVLTGTPRYMCVAAFRFLQECLEFIGYCHSRECAVWFQSPTGVEHRPAPARADPTNGD